MYLISLASGILVGVIYALIQARSPAPPAIALVGLPGMLVGERLVPIAKRVLDGEPLSAACVASACLPRITGLVSGSESISTRQQEPAAQREAS